MGFLSPAYYAQLPAAARAQLLPLGYHPDSHETFYLSGKDLFPGTYVIGVQGSGKSGLLHTMIHADAVAGRAVIVIDPHGDLVTNLVASLPPERLPHTYVLDLADADQWPFGINLFGLSGRPRNAIEKSQAVDRVMHVLKVLWPEVENQQHLPLYVRTTTIALISNPGMTLLHMEHFLTNKPFRDQVLRHVTDMTVHDLWRRHDQLSERDQQSRIQPLLNRLGGIFVGHDIVQHVLGQPTTISFRGVIEQREIILIRLPTNLLEEEAPLVGKIIVAQISAALFSFADVPERERPGFSFYIDEFQVFASPDFAKIFSEGRKYGVKICLAHQERGQIPEYLQRATMTARNKICLQTTPDDAREMAPLFPAGEATVKAEDVTTEPADHLLKYGSDEPVVDEFIEVYLRPMLVNKRGNKVDIRGRQWNMDWGKVLWHGFRLSEQYTEVYVADPMPYLNQLLYQVMRTGNPNLPIPQDAVIGFANGGRGFYPAIRSATEADLLPMTFPPHLVVHGQWVREPESAREQLLHFLFCLRGTMAYLATNPIGKKTQPNPNVVARWIAQLPQRTAFVRSGDEIGMISTHNVPEAATGEVANERAAYVRERTRAKYCHPVEQVQQLQLAEANVPPDAPSVVDVPEIAGWDEVPEP